MLAMALIVSLIGSATALVRKITIDMDYTNISVKLGGKQLALTGVNGTLVEPFSYQGTTYLPVRAISNVLGLGVNWDAPPPPSS